MPTVSLAEDDHDLCVHLLPSQQKRLINIFSLDTQQKVTSHQAAQKATGKNMLPKHSQPFLMLNLIFKNRFSPANVGIHLKAYPGKGSPGHAQGLSPPSTILEILSQPHRGGTSLMPVCSGGECGCFVLPFQSRGGSGLPDCATPVGRMAAASPSSPALELRDSWTPRLPALPTQLSLTAKPTHITWLQLASSRDTFSVLSFMVVVAGLSPCCGLTVFSIKAAEILLLLVWKAVLSRHPHRSTISPGALRLCSWHDPVDREILPSSRTVIAQAKGTSDSGFS